MFPSLEGLDSRVNLEVNSIEKLGLVPRYTFSNGKASVKVVNGRIEYASSIREKVDIYTRVLLRTEIGKYEIYKDIDFGVSYFSYIGRGDIPFGVVKSEIEREITSNLISLYEIESIENFEALLNFDKLEISFTLVLNDGTSIGILV